MIDAESHEDQILECMLALENTLLKGEFGASYTYKIQLHSGMLIEEMVDQDRSFVAEFFKEVYSARGNIVHEDKTLSEVYDFPIPINGQDIGREQFMTFMRLYLGVVLRKYMTHCEQNGRSIQQINEEMNKTGLETVPTL